MQFAKFTHSASRAMLNNRLAPGCLIMKPKTTKHQEKMVKVSTESEEKATGLTQRTRNQSGIEILDSNTGWKPKETKAVPSNC